MKVENVLEVIVGTLMVIIIAILLMPKEEVSNEPIIIEETFNEYPLTAWHDTDKKGDVVKIKYRVSNRDTFIEVVNDKGGVVHKQPFQRSPWEDGTREILHIIGCYIIHRIMEMKYHLENMKYEFVINIQGILI